MPDFPITSVQAEWHDDPVRGAQRGRRDRIDKYTKRHRHQEWIKFLKEKEIDARTPQELDLHLIADNYAKHKHKHKHKHAAVLRWLKRHPPNRMHFTAPNWSGRFETTSNTTTT